MGATSDTSPKKLVGVTIAIVAILVSATAIYFDYKHAEEASEEFKKQIEINETHNNRDEELVETQKQYCEELEEQNRQLQELTKTQKQHYDELKKEFEEVIKPHTRHEEIYDYISLLYNRLVLYRDWLVYLPAEKRSVAEAYYLEAANNFHRAEVEFRAGNFDEAQRLIDDTYTSLSEGYAAIASSNTTAAE